MIRLEAGSSDLNDLALRVNQIMDHFMQKSFFRFRPCDRWQPSINLYETDKVFMVCIDLAGVDPKRVEIRAKDKVLHIMGERPTPTPPHSSSPRIHVMEIDHGPFYRTVAIPENVDVNRIEAKYHQGLLWVELPKVKEG